MTAKRAQGRPARGPDEVGRDRIVEGMRSALRSTIRGEITRNDIAQFAGVTPALISYYFPERDDLVAAATQPVVAEYWSEMHAIQGMAGSPSERLRELIRLLVRCHHDDARILQAFRDYMAVRRSSAGPDYVAMMVEESAAIVEQWLDTGPPCSYGAEFLKDAIWGMCEFLARKAGSGTGLADQANDVNAKLKQAFMIHDLITAGMQHPARIDVSGSLFKKSPQKRRQMRSQQQGLRQSACGGSLVHTHGLQKTSSPDEGAYD